MRRFRWLNPSGAKLFERGLEPAEVLLVPVAVMRKYGDSSLVGTPDTAELMVPLVDLVRLALDELGVKSKGKGLELTEHTFTPEPTEAPLTGAALARELEAAQVRELAGKRKDQRDLLRAAGFTVGDEEVN